MKKDKICIVSLHKTGTASISLMLEHFGYMVTGPDISLYYEYMINNLENIDKYFEQYDVFQDDPWYDIFEYLNVKEYNTKFIYLIRNKDSWLKSVQTFYGADRYNNKVRRHFYGDPNALEHPKLYLEKFMAHEHRVFEYFKNQENFIKVDVRKPEDAIALQVFLGLPIKFKKFPFVNKTPKSSKEYRIKNIGLFFKGYFGLNVLVKNLIQKIFGYSRYIEIRSKIRYKRAQFKKMRIESLNRIRK